jgi:hypothetical protein
MRRPIPLSALLLLATTVACRQSTPEADRGALAAETGRPGNTVGATSTEDSLRRAAAGGTTMAAGRPDSAAAGRAAGDSARPDGLRHDTVATHALDSLPADSASPAGANGATGAKAVKAKKPLVWPTPPTPLAGSLLPAHRVVAFYGNPLSTRLGILGRIPPARMLDSLTQVAAQWQRADSTTRVQPALHLIATVAQGKPGADNMHRLRMSDATIEQVAKWAEERGWLLFLDIQIGHSTVQAELPHLMKFLQRPYVHLALDPEFAMKTAHAPGKKIGTMDAKEINWAAGQLAALVDQYQLPPKMLVVHRFTDKMLTNAAKITANDPRVQVVIDMDGFGSPSLKKGTWQRVIIREPVQYTGFKLFLNPKNDHPMMSPTDVIKLEPAPLYIQYQ